jgi:hypothetical protein
LRHVAGQSFLRLLSRRSLHGSQQVLLVHGLRYMGFGERRNKKPV